MLELLTTVYGAKELDDCESVDNLETSLVSCFRPSFLLFATIIW